MPIAELDETFDPRAFDGTDNSGGHAAGPQAPGGGGMTGGIVDVLRTLVDKQNEVVGAVNALPLTASVLATPTELTIATGAITITKNYHTVDTEADAASDDLDSIAGGDVGQVVFLRPVNDARSVVVKHSATIVCPYGKNITLAEDDDFVMLIRVSETAWVVLATKITAAAGGLLGAVLALTTTGNGAALVGIEDSGSLITGTTVETALAELAGRVRTQLVTVTATPAAEVSDNIDVTLNVVDLNGTAVSRVQRVLCEVLKADLTPATASEFRLSETGAGAEISTTASPSLLISTDANGDAVVRVHDQAGASSLSVFLVLTPVGVSGTYTLGQPTYVALTFDGS